MIEVFKTNVQEADASALLIRRLLEHFPGGRISFDLDDHDRVLRIEQPTLCVETVISLLADHGYECEVMN